MVWCCYFLHISSSFFSDSMKPFSAPWSLTGPFSMAVYGYYTIEDKVDCKKEYNNNNNNNSRQSHFIPLPNRQTDFWVFLMTLSSLWKYDLRAFWGRCGPGVWQGCVSDVPSVWHPSDCVTASWPRSISCIQVFERIAAQVLLILSLSLSLCPSLTLSHLAFWDDIKLSLY